MSNRQTLKCHPDLRCDAVARIEADVSRPKPSLLLLHYIVTGDIGALRLPPVAVPLRTDGLWQSTCFEAFVRASAAVAYYEFNFAPSMQWAAYRFDDYRSGMAPASEIDVPRIDVQSNSTGYELHVELELGRLSDLPANTSWHLGLSAVIEEKTGRKSYWALAHPAGKPDFHHSDCFALEVPTA
jgi:hypothetical protein